MFELLLIGLIVLALVLVNGLFVAAEFAVLATPRLALDAKARGGDATAASLLDVMDDPRRLDRYIATAQVGITLASLGLGMYGEHALAHWLEPYLQGLAQGRWIAAHVLATLIAVMVLTYLHIVIGEMMPKALALQHAQRTALLIARPMRIMRLAFYPVVVTLNAVANGILRLFGVRRERASSRYHSPQELRMIVEESRGSGALRKEESGLLQESLDFSKRDARDVMVPRVQVAAIRLGTAPQNMERLVASSPHTRYPVYRGDLDHVVAVVHVRDLLRAGLQRRPLAAEELESVPFVPESAPLDRVLETMRRRTAHMAVVMDEYGGTAGILTIEDIMEEIVGEIDEGSSRHPVVTHDGATSVPGSLRLDELGEMLHREVSHPEVDSVSGLVLDLLGRPAQVGDVVQHQGLRIEVMSLLGRGVATCRVAVLPRDEGEET